MQLEVGKKYRTRDGKIHVEIKEIIQGEPNYPFVGIVSKGNWWFQKGEDLTYTNDGLYLLDRIDNLDLVEEVI